MCGVTLRDRKRTAEFVERKDKSDWVSACRLRGKKMWNVCEKVDTKSLGLMKNDAHIRYKWRILTTINHPKLPQCGNEGVILYGLHSRDIKRL